MPLTELRQIHLGARFAVYRAQRDGRPVVMKRVRPDRRDAQSERRLHDEYALLGSLWLPGVVRPIALEQHAGRAALVLPDLGPIDLETWLQTHRLDLSEFLDMAVRMATIVAHVHGCGIVHRDLSPANFVLDEQGGLTLVDFELSRVVASSPEAPGIRGELEATLPYLAPEQTGRIPRFVDQRADLYMLGASFYHMLVGFPPFTSRDPLEIVHGHLAQAPTAPALIRPFVPALLSQLILKLLAKTPEWRFQTAEALRADLEEAKRQWCATGTIVPFELARLDRRELQFATRLQGRAPELAELRRALTRASAGATELVAIHGLTGSGKTALVEALRPELARAGWFVSGKCDALGGTVPFAALSQALGALTRRLRELPTDMVDALRTKVQSAVAPNGRVLTDLVPELAHWLGTQPPLSPLGPLETKNRTELVIAAFVRALGRPRQMLTLFLDDVQWVDRGSLDILVRLVSASDLPPMLVLLAYRSEEVGPTHPVAMALETMREAGAHVCDLEVGPLAPGALAQLLGDALHTDAERCRPLADVVMRKTAGNPLFAQRFLRLLQDTHALTFDLGTHSWTWDLGRIAQLPAPDSVIDLLAASIERLPNPVHRALTVAACLGGRFELALLAWLLRQSPEEVARALWEATRETLIVPTAAADGAHPGAYRFVHDRVQQAAYALLSEHGRRSLHLEIGRCLYARAPKEELSKSIFEVVDQFNRGAALLVEEAERQLLLQLNQRAASKAKAAAAYAAGLAYLRHAIALLPENAWSERHDLTFQLHLEAAELAFAADAVDEADRLSTAALLHARSRLEKAQLYLVRVSGYTLRLDVERTIAAGQEGLRLFGLELLDADPEAAIARAFATVEGLLAGRAASTLLDAPCADAPEHVAMQRLAVELMSICYQSDQKRFALLVLWGTQAALQHGHSQSSPYTYAAFGALLAAHGQYERAHAFGHLAIALSRKLGAMEARALFVFASSLNHWRAAFRDSLEVERLALKRALESGDLLFASYCQFTEVMTLWTAGAELGRLLPLVEEHLAFCRRVKSQLAVDILASHRQGIRCLMGITDEGGWFREGARDELATISDMQAHGTSLGGYANVRLWVAYLLGELAEARAALAVAEAQLPFVGCTTLRAEYVFHAALARSALANEASGQAREAEIVQIAELAEQLEIWAENCPESFRHKHTLVRAELARLSDGSAEGLYHGAIEGAARGGFLQDEAVGQELLGRYCLAREQRHVAAHWFGAALDSYARWGASAKVDLLQKELTRLELRVLRSITAPPTPAGASLGLDLLTVIKAAETLSSEVMLDRLLDKMMQICVETAGAQRGALLFAQDQRLRLEARFDTRETRAQHDGSGNGHSLDHEEAHARAAFSEAIVRHTLSTGEDVVLSNAAERGAFTGDPYVRERSSKSVLSMAVRHRERVAAVLFLENELSTHAFTEERLAMLRLLLAQAAISLENARLYDSLRANEALLRDFLEGMPVGVYVVDAGGLPTFANHKAIELLGRPLKPNLMPENTSSHYQMYLAGTDDIYPAGRLPLVRALSGETSMADDVEIRRDDRRVPLAVWGTPIRGEGGAVRYAIVAFQDIGLQRSFEAERTRLEAQLNQAQRLEAVGRLAGGVAHDFNNLLTPMLVYAEMAAAALPAESAVRAQVEQIRVAAQHAAGLTRQLLAFGRQEVLESVDLDLNQELINFERMFRRIVRADIAVELKLASDLGNVRADPVQLGRIFMNLGLNAADAMAGPGRIAFETESVVRTEDPGAPDHGAPLGRCALLRVRDTGSGMSAETLAKVFDPFFTTKAAGKGTGLGLPTIYGLVKQHGGALSVHSTLGEGTTFEIVLPCVEPASSAAGASKLPALSAAALGHGETILVVDDDDSVRSAVREILVRDGYRVLDTARPEHALELARASGPKLDLLITDLVMPGMNGRELFERLARERPLLPALLMSGYSEDIVAPSNARSARLELLRKPLSVELLRSKVRDTLAQRSRGRAAPGGDVRHS